MKLSEQIKRDHDSGDFGKALEGYSEKVESLENRYWQLAYANAINWSGDHDKAKKFADDQLNEIVDV